MKQMKKTLVVAGLLAGSMGVPAHADIIHDNYIGANGGGQDVVGRHEIYNVESMNVSFGSFYGQPTMNVSINTDFLYYLNQQEQHGADLNIHWQMGDLFLSSDGWNPYGSVPYENDQLSNGEDWEYVVVFNDRSGESMSGYLSIYQVDESNIIESNYRLGHAVAYNTSGQTPIGFGFWEASPHNTTSQVDSINMIFGISSLSLGSEIGLSWAMTCGNDIVQGSAANPVPEPATLLLFGSGLVGLGAATRRRFMR